jgi:hypothetical protein
MQGFEHKPYDVARARELMFRLASTSPSRTI